MARLRHQEILNHVVSSQFLAVCDSSQPWGQTATCSLDTTWQMAAQKLVAGVPSGA